MHFARLRADGYGASQQREEARVREGGKKSINIEISTLQADYNERAWMMAKCQLPALDATDSAYGGYANGLKPVF